MNAVMDATIYLLGTFVALACGVLLARGYRRSRFRLLLWSSVCFLGLALSSALAFLDLSVLPTAIDLHLLRRGVTAVSILILLYGLIWDSE
ncbi:MAG TPA: DUF5985 family protein [Candidatus Aquilonibacter sp.]|nr:DUF5985 family protein [Candidatus Aquilonibacter sp.]